MDIIILISLLIILTVASAYFAGTETALFSLSPMRIKSYRNDQDPKKRLIAELLHRPRDLLVTVFMLNTLVNILLQNVTSTIFGDDGSWALKVGVPLVITLFLGEIIPKNIGMQNNVPISYHAVTSINFFHKHMERIRNWTINITYPVSRMMFFFLKKEKEISKDELQHVLKTSEEHGVLHPDESILVEGYLKLHETTVKEIMVPKEDVIFYNTADPIKKLIHYFVDQECTRVPVSKDNTLDHVIGIITAKQYFLHGHKLAENGNFKKLLKKTFFVPETTNVRSCLEQFDRNSEVFAVVVDEYGSVTGIVTREDIVELVIGEIKDRRDQQSYYTFSGKNEIIASGKLELTEFNRLFGCNLVSHGNMITLGGWLSEQLGEIPKDGVTYETDDFLFKILAADPNKIKRIYINKLPKQKKMGTSS